MVAVVVVCRWWDSGKGPWCGGWMADGENKNEVEGGVDDPSLGQLFCYCWKKWFDHWYELKGRILYYDFKLKNKIKETILLQEKIKVKTQNITCACKLIIASCKVISWLETHHNFQRVKVDGLWLHLVWTLVDKFYLKNRDFLV